MKHIISTLVVALVATMAPAQTFTSLKSFGDLTNVTGIQPYSQLVQGPDGTLYGTTSDGEGNVRGIVFKLSTDGSGFTVLKWFTNSTEGATPYGSLTLSGSVLYGTTSGGGSGGYGTVFQVNTDGTGYTVLKHFTTVSDGANPRAGLTLSGGVLYGTTYDGGNASPGLRAGTVFKLNTDGSGYTILKNFNRDDGGGHPLAPLTLSGNVLYGTTTYGGLGGGGAGRVFKLNTDGSGYTVLKQFS